MNPERWKQIEDVFFSAIDLPLEERAAFLVRACGGDSELRLQVENLLANDEKAEGFITSFVLNSGVDPGATEVAGAKGSGESGDLISRRRIGAYQLVREIGRGGMGAVYLAVRTDDEVDRRVAIKLLKRGMDTDFIISRFRKERRILASFDHPNIARLLDGGTTDDGLPYFVMEYIEGLPVGRYCDAHKLSIAERLKLFEQVCAAVHYAHQRQVIHRDIKPGNILVMAGGVPKLLDFGIAKILDPELIGETHDPTATAMLMMTPDYASPEQARGERVTTATDQYSLGVLLYELLTGHRPYRVRGRLPQEIARTVSEEEPELPSDAVNRTEEVPSANGERSITTAPETICRDRSSTLEMLRRELAGGLDDIVMQALHKEPSGRYESVSELSRDIDRHLQGLPVFAPVYHSSRDKTTLALAAEPATTTGDGRPAQSQLAPKPARRSLFIAVSITALIAAIAFFVYLKPRMTAIPSRPGVDTAGAVDETIAGRRSIAVLPFKTESASEAERSLGSGLSDALTARLGRLRQLTVRPASAARRYLESDAKPQQIGRELGVEFVVAGTIQLTDERARVIARMFAVKDGSVMWEDRFDEKSTDIAAMQSLIAERVVRAFTLELTGSEQQQFNKRYTESSEAYQLYLVGRYHFGKRSTQGLNEAIKAFNQAVRLDDKFALAYAGLADCYTLLAIYQVPPPPEAVARAKENAARALALDDALAEAHTSLAYVKFYSDRDRAGAEGQFRRAIELNPSYPTAHHWLAITLAASGRHDEAEREIKVAQQLDPRSAIIKTAGAMLLYYARRYDEALEECRQALELDPGLVQAHRVSRWIYMVTRRYEEAMAAHNRERIFSGDADYEWPVIIAQLQAIGGLRDQAQSAIKRGLNSPEVKRDPGAMSYEIAVAYGLLGSRDQALAWLSKAEAVKHYAFNFVMVDSKLDDLRSDPRFDDLARKAGLSQYR